MVGHLFALGLKPATVDIMFEQWQHFEEGEREAGQWIAHDVQKAELTKKKVHRLVKPGGDTVALYELRGVLIGICTPQIKKCLMKRFL